MMDISEDTGSDGLRGKVRKNRGRAGQKTGSAPHSVAPAASETAVEEHIGGAAGEAGV